MPSAAYLVKKPRPPLLPAYPPLPVRRFTVDEYHRLIQTGILKTGEPVELISGWIVPKMPTNPTHSSVVRRLDKLLQQIVGNRAVIGIQQPITTLDSEPEPDVSVCRGPENLYFTTHPDPEDLYFAIEVSDSSLTYDRGEKLSLYARAGLMMYWIVALEERTIEVHTKPRGGRWAKYMDKAVYGLRDSIPVRIDGKILGYLKVSEVVPPGG